MLKPYFILIRATLVILLLYPTAGLQTQDFGTQSLFMEIGMGARAQGMGKAFTAIANDGSAVFWNPAGLDFIQQGHAVFYHSTLLDGYYNFAAVTYPFLNFGTFGFGVSRFAVSKIPITTEDNIVLGMADMNQEEFYLSYGKKIPWNISLGTTIKVIRMASPGNDGLKSVSDLGTAVDVGILYRPDTESDWLRNTSIGINFQNLIPPKVRLVNTDDPQPYQLRTGIARDFIFGGDRMKKLTLAVDITKSQYQSPKFHGGVEFSIHRMLTTRAGFDAGQMAFGVGTEFVQFGKYQIDYTLNIGNRQGTALHRLGLTVYFGKTIEERIQIAKNFRAEEDRKLVQRNMEQQRLKAIKAHQAMGQENFRNGNLLQALVEYEQLARLDPANEDAKIYLDSINYLMNEQLARQLADTANAMQQMTINEQNNKFVMEHFNKGNQFYKEENYLAALNEYQNALDRSPGNQTIQSAMNQAREQLNKKIAGFIARARASAAGNNFAEALKMLSQARALDPNNVTIQREIDMELKRINNRLQFLESTRNGLDAYQKGDYESAIKEFEKALLLDPNNATVREYHKKAIIRGFATFKTLEGEYEKWYLQGVDLYVEGKFQQAIILWQRILEKDPYNKRVLNAIDKAEEQIRQQKLKK